MPIGSFKEIPKTVVEWSRFFRQTQVVTDANSVGGDQLQDGSITYAKLQNVSPNSLLGRPVGTPGQVSEISVTGGLQLGSGALQIADDGVTYAKLQNISTTDRILGRESPGAGNAEEITCTAAGRALLDDADASAQRTTLGLGTAATRNTGTTGAVVPLLNGVNIHSSVQANTFGVATSPIGTQAANPDTSGATLSQLETEVNKLKQLLRNFGFIAT
jgi:hypothetical protein